VRSVTGDAENGLVFVGSSAFKVDKLVSVKELINELVSEAEQCFEGFTPSPAAV